MVAKTSSVRTTRRRLRLVDGRSPDSLSDALAQLASALDDAAEQTGWGSPPSLVRVTAWPSRPSEGFDLGIRVLDDDMGVVEALAGFTAPSDWLAIGVVTEGNARHLDDPAADRRRVRCVHLVDRRGASASTVRLQGEAGTLVDATDRETPRGRIDDVCRRALGLSTDPPEVGTLALFAILWLDRLVVERSMHPEVTIGWADVAVHHPAVAIVVDEDPTRRDEAVASLVFLGRRLAEVHDWPAVRAACAAGAWPVDELPADVAGWLDDGSFSRWTLGGYPPLEQLTEVACDLVPPPIARRVRAALRSWRLSP